MEKHLEVFLNRFVKLRLVILRFVNGAARLRFIIIRNTKTLSKELSKEPP